MKTKSININKLRLSIHAEKYEPYTFQFESDEVLGTKHSNIDTAWSNFLHANKDLLINTINEIKE